jgi:isoquinoline 1-oxidoreductase beta subunit
LDPEVNAAGEGKITGTVKLVGTAPHMRGIDMSKDPVCAKDSASDPAHLENVVVGQGGGLENVVLYISEGLTGSALTQVPTSVPVFDQKNCVYTPHVYHAFGVQCFTDELAHRANRDPVEYLLDLIGPPRTLDFTNVQYPNYGADYKTYPWETGRLRKVIEMVADKSGWAKKKSGKGHGFGFAAHRSFLTYVATVVEVEVSDDGEIRIPRVDTALDAGIVVNPEATRAQFEGAVVFGTSIVRSGEITAKNGVIQQSNFNDYPVARINEVPAQTNIYIAESSAPPAGVGEPGVPPFVAAFCNAIFAATGTRVRDLPLSTNSNLG